MKIAAMMVLGAVSIALGQPTSSTEPPAVLQGQVSFQFERVGLPVPRYTLEIHEDGTGRYQADEAASVPSQSSSAAQYMGGKHVDRTITLSPATVTKIFKQARELDRFNITCASKAKNIADTGKKTLTYIGPDGRGSCVYNYSDNKNVSALADMFLAIAFTMDEGRRLEFFHRYDRLGLDAEMSALAHEAEGGRALEMGTIAPTLESIESDTALIQRVRLRAGKLLEQSKDEK
ncbi:MAG TPA: hypothetical protein VIX42_04065 [Edaphobacter sp.]